MTMITPIIEEFSRCGWECVEYTGEDNDFSIIYEKITGKVFVIPTKDVDSFRNYIVEKRAAMKHALANDEVVVFVLNRYFEVYINGKHVSSLTYPIKPLTVSIAANLVEREVT